MEDEIRKVKKYFTKVLNNGNFDCKYFRDQLDELMEKDIDYQHIISRITADEIE